MKNMKAKISHAAKKMVAVMIIMITMIAAVPVSAATAPAVRSVSMSRTSITLTEGSSARITANIYPSNADPDMTLWRMSKGSIVDFETRGRWSTECTITARKAGIEILTFEVWNGKKATCRVTVRPKTTAPTSVKMSTPSLNLAAGRTAILSAAVYPANAANRTVSWSTSNSAVATVRNGMVTARKTGTARITARTSNGKTAACTVTVRQDNGYISVTECYNTLSTYRKKAGLSGLSRNTTLENIAKIRAKELVRKYSHTRPNGQQGPDMVPLNICTWVNNNKWRGENIAKQQKSCREVMTSWYSSPGHRANMLSRNYRKVGIAGYRYNGVCYWVQIFSS